MSSEQQDDEETRVLRDVLAQECEALAGLEQSAGNALADVSEVHARLAADGNALRDGIQAELAAARQAAADREAAAEATAQEVRQAAATVEENTQRKMDALTACIKTEMATLTSTTQQQVDSMIGEAEHQAEQLRAETQAEIASERQRLEELHEREQQIEERLEAVRELVRGDPNRVVKLNVRGTLFHSDMTTVCGRYPGNVMSRQVSATPAVDGAFYINGNPTYFHLVLDFLTDGELPAVEGKVQLKWLEREAARYKIPDLVAMCRDAHNQLAVVDVMQLLNGQKNLSGMDMRGLTVSGIDFSASSLYHAQLDNANMQRIVAHHGELS